MLSHSHNTAGHVPLFDCAIRLCCANMTYVRPAVTISSTDQNISRLIEPDYPIHPILIWNLPPCCIRCIASSAAVNKIRHSILLSLALEHSTAAISGSGMRKFLSEVCMSGSASPVVILWAVNLKPCWEKLRFYQQSSHRWSKQDSP